MMKKHLLLLSAAAAALSLTATLTACSDNDGNASATDEWLAALPEVLRDVPGIGKFRTAIDYSDPARWVSLPASPDKAVDVIYFYPTVYFSADLSQSVISDIDDAGMLTAAAGNAAANTPAYAEACNVFAPYYRQVDVNYASTQTDEAFAALMDFSAAHDPSAALDYYFEHLNQGRPYILAGHSQGSLTVLKLLAHYFADHRDRLGRMVAAYPIGYSVTDRYLAANPWLKFAEGATDTGVIVSWNTEGPGNRGARNLVIEEGAISINPLNWKRDDTYASVAENLGSVIQGQAMEGIADAQIDLERGAVIVTTEAAKPYRIPDRMADIFGPESYHGQDYGFYFMNLKDNVARRVAAYLAQ